MMHQHNYKEKFEDIISFVFHAVGKKIEAFIGMSHTYSADGCVWLMSLFQSIVLK